MDSDESIKSSLDSNFHDNFQVHALLTISQPGLTFSTSTTIPNTKLLQNVSNSNNITTSESQNTSKNNNIQVSYSWQSGKTETFTQIVPLGGIQKFESWPNRPSNILNKFDSGYNSEQRQTPALENLKSDKGESDKKCRSSFNIKLSGNPNIPQTEIGTSDKCTQTLKNDFKNTGSGKSDAGTQFNKNYVRRKVSTRSNESNESKISKKSQNERFRRAKSSPPIRLQQIGANQKTIYIDVYCTGSEDLSGNGEDSESASSPLTVFESPHYKIIHENKKSAQKLPKFFNLNLNDTKNRKNFQSYDQDNESQNGPDLKITPPTPGCGDYENKSNLVRQRSYKGKGRELDFYKMEQLSNMVKCGIRKSSIYDFDSRKSSLNLTGKDFANRYLPTSSMTSVVSNNSYPSTIESTLCRDLTQSSVGTQKEDEWDKYYEEEFNELWDSSDGSIVDKKINFDEMDLFSNTSSSIESQNESGRVTMIHMDSRKKWDTKNDLTCPGSDIRKPKSTSPPYPYDKNSNIQSGSTTPLTFSDSSYIGPFLNYSPPQFFPSLNNESNIGSISKFGTFVKKFRKPGHHIPGPAKNQFCPCAHCRDYFGANETGGRQRAYSLESKNFFLN